ncbi:MAG: Uma2 family endonuclease [Gammaproteobacteria bacterium]|nr:Uma2 family endonuclease [Gammaproteobacteria bacterium]
MNAVFTPKRFKLTATDYHRLGQAGILTENSRVELIDGELIEMAPIGARQMALVNRLTKLLVVAVGDLGVVSIQNPVALPPHSEPQPDIAILKPPFSSAAPALPEADDVMLIIEVADSTLNYDRTTKLTLYAQANVREVWIVNVPADRVETYQDPHASGYLQSKEFGVTETVSPSALPEVTLAVGDIFR